MMQAIVPIERAAQVAYVEVKGKAVVDLETNETTIDAYLYNSQGELIDVEKITLTTEESDQWGSDNGYLLAKAMEKMNYRAG